MAKDVSQTIQDSRRAAMSFLNAAKAKEQQRKGNGAIGAYNTGRAGARAADNFLRAGRVSEIRRARGNEAQNAYDLADRVRTMTDAEFDEALRSGAITPEQLRQAGEYEWDTYMGDVWTENPDNEDVPEPTYDEFMADPARYGYEEPEEDPRHFERYRSTVRQK